MLMGQMLSGPESLLAFNKGCEILRKDLKAKANRGAAKLTGVKQKLIAGLCAIAELFMTDLCEQEVAEQLCYKVLAEALKLDKNNYEALQLLASFRVRSTRIFAIFSIQNGLIHIIHCPDFATK